MRYLVVVPISHNGQRLEPGVTVDSETEYGRPAKSRLPVSRLAARGRITPLAVAPSTAEASESQPAEPQPAESEPIGPPAPEPAAAPEPQPSKRKVVAL